MKKIDALKFFSGQDEVRYFNGQSKLAKALGISHAAVAQWGEMIPLRRAYELQEITNGALKVSSKESQAA